MFPPEVAPRENARPHIRPTTSIHSLLKDRRQTGSSRSRGCFYRSIRTGQFASSPNGHAADKVAQTSPYRAPLLRNEMPDVVTAADSIWLRQCSKRPPAENPP